MYLLSLRKSRGDNSSVTESNKNTLECYGTNSENEALAHYESCGSLELQTDADRHYEMLTFKTETCGDTMDNRLYEPVDCREIRSSYDDGNNCVKEISSSFSLPEMKKSNLPEGLSTNSTIQTIPITVARDNKVRCLEKILINEETLDKIIVPTAYAESGTKSAKKIRDRFSSMNRLDETVAVNNNASKKTIRDHQVECIKKDGSATRNVFVKTKRMIFGPFRRSEERPSSRKQSDSSVDSRLPRSSKSRSKSRSASPKLCQQDALLRVSLSLPWPLRSMSKENEKRSSEAESRRNSGSKVEKVDAIQEKNSLYQENNVEDKRLNRQSSNEEAPLIDVDQEKIGRPGTEFMITSIKVCPIGTQISDRLQGVSRMTITEWDQMHRSELKCNRMQDDGERNKIRCDRVQSAIEGKRDRERNAHSQSKEKQGKGWQEIRECDQRQAEEKKQREENHARCDAVPSDLMHKLRILSDAAAKREGRMTTTESSVVSSLESRSSKIRRAKESFLSRRGGPFCRAGIEPTEIAATPEDPSRRKSTIQIRSTITERSNGMQIASKSEESEDTRNHKGTTTTFTRENEEIVSVSEEDKVGARAAARSDSLVKSASAGMINVDPDTFDRLVETNDRGCESLPRTKRRDSSSPLAKIVGKLKLSRLIRTRNVDGGNMSTITTLCRQSLLIDMRNVPGNRSHEREMENDLIEDATDDTDDDRSGETVRE